MERRGLGKGLVLEADPGGQGELGSKWLVVPTSTHITNTLDTCQDVTVVIDNSFMTPYFLRPLDHGLDIVYYSVTKYLNGK